MRDKELQNQGARWAADIVLRHARIRATKGDMREAADLNGLASEILHGGCTH